MRLDGKVAIVTGVERGLGRSEALLLASRGARVLCNDLGVTVDGTGAAFEPANEVVDAIRASGGEGVANFHDASTHAGVTAMVKQAVEAFGGVDIVVSTAAMLKEVPLPAGR